MRCSSADSERAKTSLIRGGVGIFPTDTIYGLVGSALHPETVERIFALRDRELGKPCIVLIGSIEQLTLFGIEPTEREMRFLMRWWPGAVSIILPCHSETLVYLHRGVGTIAFRVPDDEVFRRFLLDVGPLLVPSANMSGRPAATTLGEARHCFGDQVDFYVDGGIMVGQPSTLVAFVDGEPVVKRQGAVQII